MDLTELLKYLNIKAESFDIHHLNISHKVLYHHMCVKFHPLLSTLFLRYEEFYRLSDKENKVKKINFLGP